MRKHLNLLVLAVMFSLFLSSCKKTESDSSGYSNPKIDSVILNSVHAWFENEKIGSSASIKSKIDSIENGILWNSVQSVSLQSQKTLYLLENKTFHTSSNSEAEIIVFVFEKGQILSGSILN